MKYLLAFLSVVLVGLFMFSKSYAQSKWTDAFDAMWEMQWNQAGFPVNPSKLVIKDDRIVSYSINKDAEASSKKYILKALDTVAAAANLTMKEVDDQNAQLAFEVKRFSDAELSAMACYTKGVTSPKSWTIAQAKITISEQTAYYCALHELMHAFGINGHPSDGSVLTYFHSDKTTLSDLDKFMLKHWNSSFTKPGINVFRFTRQLNKQWIEEFVPNADQSKAREVEEKWFANIIVGMDKFAAGRGEPPRILYRSGTITPDGLKFSAQYIKALLGSAYMFGWGVDKSPEKAKNLLFELLKSNWVGVANMFVTVIPRGDFWQVDIMDVCDWLSKASLSEMKITQTQLSKALKSESCAVKNKVE